MTKNTLNANINGTATVATGATFIAPATFSPVTIAPAFVPTIGFAGWINRALNNGRRSLRLNLGQDFVDGLLRYRPRINWNGGKRGNLHGILPSDRRETILPELYQKNINHFVFKLNLDKLLIFNLFSLVQGNTIRLSTCILASKS
jgi:hypothetical protein